MFEKHGYYDKSLKYKDSNKELEGNSYLNNLKEIVDENKYEIDGSSNKKAKKKKISND